MKKIIIIGGGIAGLSAGIFAQKNGFESVILEINHNLGGECTGWDRQGYHIDGCIHWLVGTKPGTPIHDLWVTVGALNGVGIYHPESFLAFEHDGIIVHFYRDLDRLRSSWLELSPEDKAAIEDFCQVIRKLQSYETPVEKPEDLMTLMERIRLMISLKDAGTVMQKYGKVSLKDYSNTFKHPALQAALASFLPEGYSASFIFFALAAFTRGQASIPYGGSKALATRMVERYLTLGGAIEAPCEAVELTIAHNKVNSVICHNGKTFEADYFIAACDAHVLYERLLKGEYPDRAFQKRYSNPTDYPLVSQILVALGYEGTIGALPRSLSFPAVPFEIHQSTINRLTMTHYRHEPAFAPEGHTLITCSINQFHEDYEAWNALARDPEAYTREKEKIGKAVLRAIETRFPRMKGKLKVLDVATPKTYERYCNAYRGAFMPFSLTIRGKMMEHTGRIKGLDNLFLTGQWLQPPGGLPVAVITGKDTIMRLCKQEKKPFVSV
ncbi:NAD(P)/FAD-dependent oxidoreductase [Methanosarcina sp. 2.H.A.1B.4]|uniref:phytoene desaturase family protein n=1 Tax=Methanosarcina sp. 2.H.A.1B.4 TaxID=1483600 RepID=UPI0006224EAE|nr:FAD-dependent oxidoreductase [Methanosarcina sp. 2.H.A.1B.4]KKG08721.1 FAD-dependent oxidoreductase [Methanosarcina sp. 2.H.A.1B.4]